MLSVVSVTRRCSTHCRRIAASPLLLCLQAVPAEKLLVFEVSQGWGPLCRFLGKPVPQQPFPHVNDREEWRKRLQAVRRMNAALTYGMPAVAVALAAAGVAVGRAWLQRARLR